MIDHVNAVALAVRDVKKCAEFYRDKIGFKLEVLEGDFAYLVIGAKGLPGGRSCFPGWLRSGDFRESCSTRRRDGSPKLLRGLCRRHGSVVRGVKGQRSPVRDASNQPA